MAVDEPSELEAATRALPAGWSGSFVASAASTQDAARAAAAAGAPSRTIVVADFQTAGRGRHGRVWLARPGSALLLSVLLRQDGPPRPWRSTALGSVALAEAIEAVAPRLRAEIKWPNDVLLDGRKVAGILAEATYDGRRHTTIVGIGVNVGTPAAELLRLGVPATSLRLAAGVPIGRGDLLRALIGRMDDWLGQSEAALQAAWQARLWGRGQRLRLADTDGEVEVVVLGAETDGALRVRLADGTVRRTMTGELIL